MRVESCLSDRAALACWQMMMQSYNAVNNTKGSSLSTEPTQQQMDAGIQQLNLGYNPDQDRLLLRIGLSNGEELQVWITQRIAKTLWKLLSGEAQLPSAKPNEINQMSNQAPSQAVQQFQQEVSAAQVLQKMDFATEYQPRKEVIHQGAVLATKLHLVEQNGQKALELATLEGVGMRLNLNEELTLAICNMLQLATKEASWDIGASAVAANVMVMDAETKQVLH